MKYIKKISDRIKNPGTSFEEHIVTLLAVVGDIALLIALIFDILGRENIVECIVLGALILALPAATTFSIRIGKVSMGAFIQTCFLVFLILPVTFFFGGGPAGGGVFWISFTYLYIGLALSGIRQIFMIFSLSGIVVLEYISGGYHPELVIGHGRGMVYLDTLVSILLVGFSIFTITMYQKKLFLQENKRAQEETERAEELNRSQNRFFSSMSHEIRTPINTILGLNEIILRQEDASEEIVRDAENIQGAGKMLLALVNDILDVSKMEAGKMDIVPVHYHVGALVSEIVSMIWLRAKQKGLQFEVKIDPSIPAELFGDEVRIKQILINLLNNSVKYTKEGTVSLYMECQEKTKDQVLLMMSVSDTGIGIKQDVLPYLFDAFRRVDEEENRKIEGTGLGLSIVRQLVEQMGGKIAVNSVYAQGSTFTVTLRQAVAGPGVIGEMNITGEEGTNSVRHYKCSFRAPDASVLIVDDNEMNLEVEKKLLSGTGMEIDTASGGNEALGKTLNSRYDVILMDHLMPEMDGIECLKRIREQMGGLNKEKPVIALTANAGAENKKLYHMSGFDGYLVKPVSGRQLEEMILKYLPAEKVLRGEGDMYVGEEMNTADRYKKKVPVLITTSSMCDLPEELIKDLHLEVIPFRVNINGRVFDDGTEACADELIWYMDEENRLPKSEPPSEADYEDFFADKLKGAHQIIHIALTKGVSEEYERATAAAGAFENVVVFNSECLSSSMGIIAMAAAQMAKQDEPVEEILKELYEIKKRIHCSFLLSVTDYMQRNGFIKEKIHRFMKALALRPSLKVSNNRFGVDRIYMGRIRKCYKKYIHHAIPKNTVPDSGLLFVTYADMPEEELVWLEQQMKKRFPSVMLIFQEASAAITLNCGSGTFGLLYMEKGKQDYHLNSLFGNLKEEEPDTGERKKRPDAEWKDFRKNEPEMDKRTLRENERGVEKQVLRKNEFKEEKQLPEENSTESIEGLDIAQAEKNCGSREVFFMALQIFYDTIQEKSEELEESFRLEDWKNYTIKIHALKSSARLVGAMGLVRDAERMEHAGKSGETDYLKEHHEELIKDYQSYLEHLQKVCGKKPEKREKPVADQARMERAYEKLSEAAEDMDFDRIENIFHELGRFSVPEEEKERFALVQERADQFDYKGMLQVLKKIEKE